MQFKHKGQVNEIQGIVFAMNGYRFNGSKVNRQFGYSKIDIALNRDNYVERQMLYQPQDNRKEISPISNSGGSVLLKFFLGLFSTQYTGGTTTIRPVSEKQEKEKTTQNQLVIMAENNVFILFEEIKTALKGINGKLEELLNVVNQQP